MKAKVSKSAVVPGSARTPQVFRCIWTGAILLLTSLPALFHWWATPPGYHYTWAVPPYPEDSFGYMAWAEQARHGALLFKLKYTALPHAPFLFHPLFLVCGWVSRALSLPIGVVFWLAKTAGVFFFLVVLWHYLNELRLSLSALVAASLLVTLASGLGGMLVLCGAGFHGTSTAIDLWVPESSTFWSLLWNPLFPWSLSCLLLSIFWVERGSREGAAADFWKGGAAAALLALLHPYSIPLVFLWVALVTGVRCRARAPMLLLRFFAVAGPVALYVGALSRLLPILARHGSSGEMTTPGVWPVVLGFGVPLLIVALSLLLQRSALLKPHWHLFLWLALALALAYAPWWFQRKLLFGAQIPLAILAAIALDRLVRQFRPGMQPAVWTGAAILLGPLCLASSWHVVNNEFKQIDENRESAYYISEEMNQALQFLRGQGHPDRVVFATPATSRFIPALAGNTTVWGHWAMAVDKKEREEMLGRVLDVRSDLNDATRAADFWSTGIDYVFADGGLRQSIARYPFVWGVILRDAPKSFENRSVTIYERARP